MKLKTQNKMQKRIDRKAWIRILEAFLAILLIIGSVLVIIDRNPVQRDISEEIYQTQRNVLNLISKNDSLRGEVVTTLNTANNPMINNYIKLLVPSSWNFSTDICGINAVCGNSPEIYDRDVYATEVLITSTLTDYNPRKLRFFVWIE